jgi:hypothetical protein
MTERDRIILSMSPIERERYRAIGGVVPGSVIAMWARQQADAARVEAEIAAMRLAARDDEDRRFKSALPSTSNHQPSTSVAA